jgi:hypothetical protein
VSEHTEIWRPVVGYEGQYEVSDLGRVRSLDRLVVYKRGGIRLFVGRIRRHSHIPSGHQIVKLSVNSKSQAWWVHRLVAAAFIGPCPDGLEVCHNNGDPTDNQVQNLRYDTHKANMQDAVRQGRNAHARKTHCPRGHRYDRFYPGGRHCSICDGERDRARTAVTSERRRTAREARAAA